MFHCTGPYALNALSPMVFKFISGSLSRSVSLEYLVLYREWQSYNSTYAIASHNVLICLSKLLGQRR